DGPGLGAIVEIGSFVGLSTAWLATGSKASGREKVFAIDHFAGSPEHQAGGSHESTTLIAEGSTYGRFLGNVSRAGVADHIEPRNLPLHVAALDWVGPIRLLFIDSDHSFEATREDFEVWSPHGGLGGLIALHDVGTWPGVTRFYDGLSTDPRFSHVLSAR